MQARLTYKANMNGVFMEMYELMADSTDRTDMDFIWTNRKKINQLEVMAASQFSVSNIPPPPDYISSSRFGIVSGSIQMLHTKVALSKQKRRFVRSTDPYVSLDKNFNCSESVSPENPETSVFNCTITQRFDRSLENGDNLTIKFSTESGGYRTLRNTNAGGGIIATQSFSGQMKEVDVQFRFDLDLPFHCQESASCGNNEVLLDVQDVTKDALQMRWSGWQDQLSGMHRYALEVFVLNMTRPNQLGILKPLQPLFITEVYETNGPLSQIYQPPSPGMYAVILEAGDLANNTKYVRRLVLYDPVSGVDTDPAHHLRFTTASPMDNYAFQNNTSAPVVTWEGFFVNRLHEENALLGSVDPYPSQLEDSRKRIPPQLDDDEGERTVKAIPNERGIVEFEVRVHRKSGKVEQSRFVNPPASTLSWQSTGLNQVFRVRDDVNVGETVIVWVRASDMLGNQRVERAIVTVDNSPPEVGQMTFLMNTRVPGIDFSSRFELAAQDEESGITHVNWRFTRSNGTEIYSKTVPSTPAENCVGQSSHKCYCNRRNQCFLTDVSLSLSNCHMMVEKESLDTEIISVTAEVVNRAGLVLSRSMQKGKLADLNGTEEYFPPQNLRVIRLSETSATLTWDFPPSCFSRKDIMVVYPGHNGEQVTEPVHKDAKRYDLVDLEPGRQYRIELYTSYVGNINSNRQALVFSSLQPVGLTGGQKAGVGIGVVVGILLLVVVVVLLLLMKRRPVVFRKMRDSLRNSTTDKKNVAPPKAAVTYTQSVHDEDLYLPVGHTWESRQPWQVKASQLTLHNQIGEGKFADIYSATWSRPGNNGQLTTVAAKVLKGGFGQNEVNTMMSKIQFFANKVGSHSNVLLFHGAVLDNDFLGPVLMLEYCESGQLDKWLKENQAKVTEDTVEKLYRFCRDIACGMEYLASKGIVHTRLAARNVLLTFILDAKVAGFGPKDGTENKVSAKWSAPEVLEERPATEKSDVWSYGVTLWEIFSLGKTPYSDIRGAEIGTHIKAGKRMEKPELANDMFHKLMQNCWQEKQRSRPSFADISKELQDLFSSGQRKSEELYYMASHIHK
ncbi:hypothetical protein V1264_005597 [Littorina saxatilis]|uniref:Receptor protein-tyrosine kinase n=2 Tax=Littorina saxatilis TaxID=31220 RepID=A0AAN9G5M1_9CAEN